MKKEIIVNTLIQVFLLSLTFLLGHTYCEIEARNRALEVLHKTDNPNALMYVATGETIKNK
jgi:hypothetical protein